MKKANLVFGPVTVGGLRVAGGALVLLLIAVLSRRWVWPQRNQVLPLSIIISIGYIIPYTMQPWLIRHCESGFVGMIVGFVPLMTIVVSIPLLHIRPNRAQLIGVFGGLFCLFLVLLDGLHRSFDWWYMPIGLLVPMMYAITNTIVKRNFSTVPPLVCSSWCLLGASLLLLPLGLLIEPVQEEGPLALAVTAVLILGVLGTGIVMYAFYKLIGMRGPLYAGLVAYIIPIGAVLIGGLDGERISIYQVLAMLGIIVMVVLVQRHTREPASEAIE